MSENWHGLVKILEIEHLDCDGSVLWKAKNLRNVLHTDGEQLLLQSMFVGGRTSNTFIPSNFYFGLDSRSTVAVGDIISGLSGEPTDNGYARFSISSSGQFAVSQFAGIYQAVSPIVTFTASGGSWGPVLNLFMTSSHDSSGILISSVPLSSPLTVISGQTISLKMGLSLQDISV
jgi:hypothetical protein